jgi:hypothetical protein
MAVHPDSALVLGCGMDFGEIEPGIVAGSIAIAALPEEEEVDANVRAGVGAEAALGQPEGADKIGAAGDVFTRGGARFVHRAMRCHESRETSRLQSVDRLGDEIVMQAKAEGPERPVAAHRAIGKRRIADGQIEVLGEFGPCEVLVDDRGARMQQGCDARRDRIEFDAGDMAEPRRFSGISAGNRPVPIPGSSTRPPRKPSRVTPVQTARAMYSGVKWAYWVQRASEA